MPWGDPRGKSKQPCRVEMWTQILIVEKTGWRTDMQIITLEDERARVDVVPELGGGIARFDARSDGRPVRLLRPWSGATDPFELGCNLLVPWSNRISSGGFRFEGRFHPLAPNFAGQELPIHGNGFQSPWAVARRSQISVELEFESDGPGPFRYSAIVTYRLQDGALTLTLGVKHCADTRLPYGLGFHPWFERTEHTVLRAPAKGIWLVDERQLPTKHISVADRPEWDFRRSAPLPDGFIDNGFTGWSRKAVIIWQDRGIEAVVSASENLGCYLVHSPSPQSGFFCFEPISHPVDAHNFSGEPEANGLAVLSKGDELSASMTIGWRHQQEP